MIWYAATDKNQGSTRWWEMPFEIEIQYVGTGKLLKVWEQVNKVFKEVEHCKSLHWGLWSPNLILNLSRRLRLPPQQCQVNARRPWKMMHLPPFCETSSSIFWSVSMFYTGLSPSPLHPPAKHSGWSREEPSYWTEHKGLQGKNGVSWVVFLLPLSLRIPYDHLPASVEECDGKESNWHSVSTYYMWGAFIIAFDFKISWGGNHL